MGQVAYLGCDSWKHNERKKRDQSVEEHQERVKEQISLWVCVLVTIPPNHPKLSDVKQPLMMLTGCGGQEVGCTGASAGKFQRLPCLHSWKLELPGGFFTRGWWLMLVVSWHLS